MPQFRSNYIEYIDALRYMRVFAQIISRSPSNRNRLVLRMDNQLCINLMSKFNCSLPFFLLFSNIIFSSTAKFDHRPHLLFLFVFIFQMITCNERNGFSVHAYKFILDFLIYLLFLFCICIYLFRK